MVFTIFVRARYYTSTDRRGEVIDGYSKPVNNSVTGYNNAISHGECIYRSNHHLKYDRIIYHETIDTRKVTMFGKKRKKVTREQVQDLDIRIRSDHKTKPREYIDRPITKQEQERELTHKKLQTEIKDERKASNEYKQLSKRLKGRDKMTVQKISKQEKQHEKELIKIDRKEYKEFLKWKNSKKK